jgi:hypothetical protein
MHGDGLRVAKALELVADLERRYCFFPAALFDEHAWNMLLHLFICLFDNEVMPEARLIELVHASPETGRRWLSYLVKAGHVEAREDGGDVVMTAETLGRMRAYLTRANEAASTA